ncbi:hypothetical protein M3Y97_00549100 [Aphelenchoides bicaudatus]|nr:hypothetical protein M3Y97_00549100 [Aphelenchoides bicaudatus]
MIARSVLICLIVVTKCFYAQQPAVKIQERGSATELAMNKEASMEMYQKWMDQAFSGLFSAIASKNLKRLSDGGEVDLEECTKNSKTVINHAKCLKQMFRNRDEVQQKKKIIESSLPTKAKSKADGNWIGGFRVKREVKRAESYDLIGRYSGLTPIGSVAYTINRAMASNKNRTSLPSWQETIENVRQSAMERKQARAEISKRFNEDKNLSNMERLAFRTIDRKAGLNKKFEEAIDDPKKLLDIAKEEQKGSPNQPIDKLTNLVRDGVKLGFRLADKNMTDEELDEKTLKMISPRFLSVVPDNDTDTINFISPSLFSIHDKGTGLENLTSLPNLISGFSSRDQQEWLNFIIEAAGVDDQAKKLNQETAEMKSIKRIENYEEEVRNPKTGQPLYFTKENVTDVYGNEQGDFEKQKIETFERLTASYTPKQMNELNSTGFSIMSKQQIKMLYGEDSPYYDNKTYHRLSRMSKSYIHGQIENEIKTISEMDKFEVRQKDIALSPVVLTPLVLVPQVLSNLFIVLSPLVLSPIILSPAVLGPIILSPLVFIPIILSPRVLSPFVLTPFIFTPIVLSPLVLHPLILSPGVFNPIILSPLVLTPLILSPQVFSPLVLSPLVLNPLILNPGVGFPLVLSPFVLSPLILSPQVLFGLILSPYVLSPVVESKVGYELTDLK